MDIDKNQKIKNIFEKWTKKYKESINCSDPKGFSQRAHCQGKKKNSKLFEKQIQLKVI